MTLIPLQSPTQRKLTRDAKRRKFTEEAAPGFPPIPTATPQPADEPFLTFAARPESPGSQTPFESGRLPQGFVQKREPIPIPHTPFVLGPTEQIGLDVADIAFSPLEALTEFTTRAVQLPFRVTGQDPAALADFAPAGLRELLKASPSDIASPATSFTELVESQRKRPVKEQIVTGAITDPTSLFGIKGGAKAATTRARNLDTPAIAKGVKVAEAAGDTPAVKLAGLIDRFRQRGASLTTGPAPQPEGQFQFLARDEKGAPVRMSMPDTPENRKFAMDATRRGEAVLLPESPTEADLTVARSRLAGNLQPNALDNQVNDLTQRIADLDDHIESLGNTGIHRPKWAVGLTNQELEAIARHEGLNPYGSVDWADGIDSVIIKEAKQGAFKQPGADSLTSLRRQRSRLRRELREAQRQVQEVRVAAQRLDNAAKGPPRTPGTPLGSDMGTPPPSRPVLPWLTTWSSPRMRHLLSASCGSGKALGGWHP